MRLPFSLQIPSIRQGLDNLRHKRPTFFYEHSLKSHPDGKSTNTVCYPVYYRTRNRPLYYAGPYHKLHVISFFHKPI